MNRQLGGWLIAPWFVLSASTSYAIELTVRDNDVVNAPLSREGLTRIAVVGSRLEQTFSADGKYLRFQVDKRNGQVFIRYKSHADGGAILDEIALPAGGKITRKSPELPKKEGRSTFSIFITDDVGRTFNINLHPSDNPAETVLLKPMNIEKPQAGRLIQSDHDQALPSEVMTLIQLMAQGANEVSGYTVDVDLQESVALWKGTDFTRIGSYENEMLTGEVYRLVNRTGQEMRLVESEFQAKGVLGVTIQHPILKNNESTEIYIVRESDS